MAPNEGRLGGTFGHAKNRDSNYLFEVPLPRSSSIHSRVFAFARARNVQYFEFSSDNCGFSGRNVRGTRTYSLDSRPNKPSQCYAFRLQLSHQPRPVGWCDPWSDPRVRERDRRSVSRHFVMALFKRHFSDAVLAPSYTTGHAAKVTRSNAASSSRPGQCKKDKTASQSPF